MKTEIVMGILAHVDAGKTTLSESILYNSGIVQEMGRVDNQNAFLDNHYIEKERGITIFSKQARLNIGENNITLLDTPGHVDFSAEMERTLWILDYAILVISGADGIQGHTKTLWKLLKQYKIPTILFVNKMDISYKKKMDIMKELNEKFSERCCDFSEFGSDEFYENYALLDEERLEEFLKTGIISESVIQKMIVNRKVFPCYFGSALKNTGVLEMLDGLSRIIQGNRYSTNFGARIYKVTRDAQGEMLTHLKVTGGVLNVKDQIEEVGKINQIRMISGEKYQVINSVYPGGICAVTGLQGVLTGRGIGFESNAPTPTIQPVLRYTLIYEQHISEKIMLEYLKKLEQEIPELSVSTDEVNGDIQICGMGEVQMEIVQQLIYEQYQIKIAYGPGKVTYKESIQEKTEGVGHFEPLRHYAEIHVLLEPLNSGAGIIYKNECKQEMLPLNWQKTAMTYLKEEYPGVLTGSPITDIKITLLSGKIHEKHTEGGDVREAVRRAIRQGLKKAKSILLEPYFNFQMHIPKDAIGKALFDLEQMHGVFEPPEVFEEYMKISGKGPVICMSNYAKDLMSYTGGVGQIEFSPGGYELCHNEEEVIEQYHYCSEEDLQYPTGSLFCKHGSAFYIPWDQVENYMHIDNKKIQTSVEDRLMEKTYIEKENDRIGIGEDEIEKIINQTSFANAKIKSIKHRKSMKLKSVKKHINHVQTIKKESYLLVDGYNVIFAWKELKELAELDMEAARVRLLEILSNYQGILKEYIIVVFDAYKVQGSISSILDYQNIKLVYTAMDETADSYIEKFVYENCENYNITVATSDYLEQITVRGKDCRIISARELELLVYQDIKNAISEYQKKPTKNKAYLEDVFPSNITKKE